MNKTELVKEIATRTKLTQKDISTVIDAFQDAVKDTVAKGNKVSLMGFITFDKKHIPSKTGVSKLNGIEKPWISDARDEVTVKLSKKYKEI